MAESCMTIGEKNREHLPDGTLHTWWRWVAAPMAGLALALAAILLFSLLALRAQLQANMQAQALDDAGAISLALQPYMAGEHPQDQARTRDTLLTALLQSGGYGELTLLDLDGVTLFRQQAPHTVVGVPAWFRQWLPVTAPLARAEVLAGWDMVGVVALTRHPAASYRALWRAALGMAGPGLMALALACWFRQRQWRQLLQREYLQRAQVKALQQRIYQLTVTVEELKKTSRDETFPEVADDE